MFFPTEAKLAMEIAHAETTSDLAGLLSSRALSGNLIEVDLNETPSSQKKRLISKIETLSRTGITNSFSFCFPLFIILLWSYTRVAQGTTNKMKTTNTV